MEGQRLGGRYQVETRIGGGGMAIVYKAKDLILHRQVAVKILRSQFGMDEDFVNRFHREAQAVASLSHPNVVGVYDVGQDDETHYIVMEYIEGHTLKEVINQQGALPIEEAVRISVQICDALDHAHQNNIIHRDIKPHNIMIGKNGRVKVTDFGIARAVTSTTITHTNSILGSVHYFSPEQARGGVSAEKSDIYSLGIVLYEMVTGQLPFSGDSPITIALKHLQEPLPEPRESNPNIPQSVENIIFKALVKDPFLRYSSARAMLLDLETCLLPERRDEEKVVFPVDNEQTRVVPVITPEMLEQAYQTRPSGIRGRSGQEEEERKGKQGWWKKTLGWFGAIGLFIVLAFFGFSFLLEFFGAVPEVSVPHVEGTQVTIAEKKIRDANLMPTVVEESNPKIEKGLVIRQDPAPPMRIKENATVTLYVSKGEQAVPMPNLVSYPRATAEEMLRQKGFTITNETFIEREHEEIALGQVIEQKPLADELVKPSEAKVQVVVSKGKKYVEMPDVLGMSVEMAQLELLKAGLAADKPISQPTYNTEQVGMVLSTHPFTAKMQVAIGTVIPLMISNGEYPADAKVGSTPIYVELMPGETTEIKIVLSDARGDHLVAFQETLTESREYMVPFVLSPEKNLKIQAFKQDQLYLTANIEYNSLP